jgi:hypothetical protein
MPQGREVKNGQPSVRQGDTDDRILPSPPVIGSAMIESMGHTERHLAEGAAAIPMGTVNNPADPAHALSLMRQT